MLYRLVRPMRRGGSRSVYFMQRIPADVKARAIGLKLELPSRSETVPLTISPKASFIKVSLRTAEPTEAKVRHATLAAYLETVWRALREDAPIPLTHRQATALAGRLYRAWTSGEGRERTTSVIVMRGGDRRSDDESADDCQIVVKTMINNDQEWFDDYADETEDLQIDEYDITASPNDFNVLL